MRYFGIEDIKSLKELYRDKLNFIFIYISEAHASDEWPISLKYNPCQHKKIEDRIRVANEFKKEFELDISIYVDSMNDENFEKIYSCWPERAFIFHNSVIEYISYARVNGRMQWRVEIEKLINKD